MVRGAVPEIAHGQTTAAIAVLMVTVIDVLII